MTSIGYTEARTMKELAERLKFIEEKIPDYGEEKLKRTLIVYSIQKDGDNFCAIYSWGTQIIRAHVVNDGFNTWEQNTVNAFVANGHIPVMVQNGGPMPVEVKNDLRVRTI